jgi:hypothetical protein
MLLVESGLVSWRMGMRGLILAMGVMLFVGS